MKLKNIIMKLKNIIKNIFFILVCYLVFGCTNQKKNTIVADNIIYFDSQKCVQKFDLKNITDSTFQIFPLETNDDCLISKIDKIEIKDNRIYIMDKLAQSVYIFDMTGKYLNKINSRGQGPGEYVNLSYMTVTDNSVIVIDHFIGKQLEYSALDFKFIKEERIFEKIWATEVFYLSGTIYYVNDGRNSNSGKFALFSRENDAKNFNKYLSCGEEPLSLGLNGPVYAINGDEVSLIYSGDDIIYRLRGDKVFPEYEIKYKDKKVVYSSGVEDILDNPGGRVIGINAINESDKYLFIDISMTTEKNTPLGPGNYDSYTCLYNKLDHTTIIYPFAFNSSFYNVMNIMVDRIIDNKIICWYDAHSLLFSFPKEEISRDIFNNKVYESCFKKVLANLKDDDNPVLFIYNLK
jgi:hypothetical protein